ncbi:MAG: N-acetyltransferase [Opitutaceae bacterium]
MTKTSIRPEMVSDYEAIHNLVSEVFRETYGSGEQEAELVKQIRQRPEYGPTISLVADIHDVVVGHVLFSAVRLSKRPEIAVCALAPLGVYRQYQKQGIGSKLVLRGLQECASRGYKAVFVQGSLKYYPRFGFKPIRSTRLQTIFNSDHDMVLELEAGVLDKVSGLVDYPMPWNVFK